MSRRVAGRLTTLRERGACRCAMNAHPTGGGVNPHPTVGPQEIRGEPRPTGYRANRLYFPRFGSSASGPNRRTLSSS